MEIIVKKQHLLIKNQGLFFDNNYQRIYPNLEFESDFFYDIFVKKPIDQNLVYSVTMDKGTRQFFNQCLGIKKSDHVKYEIKYNVDMDKYFLQIKN